MKKSLTPLIVSFAIIILLTFIVINTKSIKVSDEELNPEEKNILTLGTKRDKKRKIELQQGKNFLQSRFQPEIPSLLDSARRHLANNEKDEAEDLLKTILVFQPNEQTALSLLGGIYYRAGKYKEAEELFRRLAISEEWKNASTLNHLASVYARQGKYKEAFELCLKAQELQPDFAEAYINLSAIYAAAGENDGAIKQLFLAYKLMGHQILSYSVDPVFDKIRALPEFQDIVQKAKKDWEEKINKEKSDNKTLSTDEQNKDSSRGNIQ